MLRYTAANWAKENGIYVIHHGGGTDNSSENSLYRFKKQFTKGTEFGFYIGKKIWAEYFHDNISNRFQNKTSENNNNQKLYPCP